MEVGDVGVSGTQQITRRTRDGRSSSLTDDEREKNGDAKKVAASASGDLRR